MNEQFVTERNYKKEILLILAMFGVLLFMVLFFNSIARRDGVSVPSETVLKKFDPIITEAKGVFVYDLREQKILYTKNENARLPLASLTKVMSVLVARDLGSSRRVVLVDERALQAEGDSGLYRGEKWILENLIDFSLITSSNDGIRAMALSLGALSNTNASSEEIIDDFVTEMNIKAGKLGLKDTYFWNETGLDMPISTASKESAKKGGAYGSARDISKLMEYALVEYPGLFEATQKSTSTIESLDNHPHLAKNTNSLIAEIPGLLISKTGYTDLSGGNLAFIFDPELGHPIIVSILGSTAQGRFEDARRIVVAVLKYLKQ